MLFSGQAFAGSGRIVKVLPQFLDLKGLHDHSPSLYERDAYQAYLREHPTERSGMRFAVECRIKRPVSGPVKLKLELRGSAQAGVPNEQVLEQIIKPGHRWGQWVELKLTGETYRQFGELTAWRATLWEHDQLLSEQKSFLW